MHIAIAEHGEDSRMRRAKEHLAIAVPAIWRLPTVLRRMPPGSFGFPPLFYNSRESSNPSFSPLQRRGRNPTLISTRPAMLLRQGDNSHGRRFFPIFAQFDKCLVWVLQLLTLRPVAKMDMQVFLDFLISQYPNHIILHKHYCPPAEAHIATAALSVQIA